MIDNPPHNVSIDDKDELIDIYYRGYHLYKATCSGCHSNSKGRDTIPYYTLLQLDEYEATVKKDPSQHAVAKKLSPEQLRDIMQFLYYRTLSWQVQSELSEKKIKQ